MSITSGIRSGLRSGVRSGMNPGSDPMAGVSVDATSSKYVPSNASQWTDTLSAAGIASGNPFSLWLMQETSGALADSIGVAPLTVSSFAYNQSYAGWSRKAMIANDLGGFNALNTTDASMPALSTQSCLVIGYLAIEGAPVADRGVIIAGGVRAIVTAANAPKIHNGTSSATGAQSVTTAIRPWVLRHNVTASTQALFTDLEKVPVAFAASAATKRIFYGAAIETCPNIRVVYGCAFKGAAAELSDAQVRTLLTTLGWTVAW